MNIMLITDVPRPLHFKHTKRRSLQCDAGFQLMKNNLHHYLCKKNDSTQPGVEKIIFTRKNELARAVVDLVDHFLFYAHHLF